MGRMVPGGFEDAGVSGGEPIAIISSCPPCNPRAIATKRNLGVSGSATAKIVIIVFSLNGCIDQIPTATVVVQDLDETGPCPGIGSTTYGQMTAILIKGEGTTKSIISGGISIQVTAQLYPGASVIFKCPYVPSICPIAAIILRPNRNPVSVPTDSDRFSKTVAIGFSIQITAELYPGTAIVSIHPRVAPRGASARILSTTDDHPVPGITQGYRTTRTVIDGLSFDIHSNLIPGAPIVLEHPHPSG